MNETENAVVSEEIKETGNQPEITPGGKKEKVKLPLGYDLAGVVCSAVIVILVLFTFVFRFVGVVGPSMQPTLYNGDWLLVTALKSHYSYGDIIISTQPNMFNEPIVKRVIATGGQTVRIDFSTGGVYVDDVLLDEDYITGNTTDPEDFSDPVTVPEGKLFVMGDNREHSTDSRSNAIGFVDERYIVGKAMVRVFPTNQLRFFK